MSAKEAADFLRLSKNSLRQIAPSLPRHKRLGMSYRCLCSELLEWLVSQGDDDSDSSSARAKPGVSPRRRARESTPSDAFECPSEAVGDMFA